MTTTSDLHALAKTRAECAQRLEMLGVLNTPTDYEKRIAADAQYQLAKSAYQRAEDDYQRALSMLTTQELINLSKATGGEVQP